MRTEFPEEEMLDRSFRDKVFRARGGGERGFFNWLPFFVSLYIFKWIFCLKILFISSRRIPYQSY